MAKISNLVEATEASDDMELEVNDSGASKRITKQNLIGSGLITLVKDPDFAVGSDAISQGPITRTYARALPTGGTKGATLPTGSLGGGEIVIFLNVTSAISVNVYPPPAGTIDDGSYGSPVEVAGRHAQAFICISTVHWATI